jgi:hypothetical protein
MSYIVVLKLLLCSSGFTLHLTADVKSALVCLHQPGLQVVRVKQGRVTAVCL